MRPETLRRVLFVEVSDSNNSVPSAAERLGCLLCPNVQCVGTASLSAALALARGEAFDLVVVDWRAAAADPPTWSQWTRVAVTTETLLLFESSDAELGQLPELLARWSGRLQVWPRSTFDHRVLEACWQRIDSRRQAAEQQRNWQQRAAERSRRVAELESAAQHLFDGWSHELRTPLAVVAQYLAVLRTSSTAVLAPEDRRALDLVADRAHEMDLLVGDLLVLQRHRLGLLSAWRRPVDTARLLAESLALVPQKAALKQVDWSAPAIANMPAVVVDADHLRLALARLAGGAVSSAAPGGRVAFACQWDEPAGLLEMRLTVFGAGDDLYAEYGQAPAGGDAPTSNWLESIDRPTWRLIRLLSELNLASFSVEHPASGPTVFRIRLPLAQPLALAERFLALVPGGHSQEAPLSGLSLALAPDDAWMAPAVDEFLQRSLRRQGWSWQAAAGRWWLLVPRTAEETVELIDQIGAAWADPQLDWPLPQRPELAFHLEWQGRGALAGLAWLERALAAPPAVAAAAPPEASQPEVAPPGAPSAAAAPTPEFSLLAAADGWSDGGLEALTVVS